MRSSVLPVAFVFGLFAAPAVAQTGFYLPTGVNSYGQDEFRAADGTTCRSTMDGAKRIELGAFGSGNRADNNPYALPGYSYGTGNGGNAGVYGRFTMSLDAAPDRMNCNLLYKLEMERRALELEMMKRSLTSADRQLDAHLKQASNDEPTEPEAPASRSGKKSATKPSKVAANRRGSFPPP